MSRLLSAAERRSILSDYGDTVTIGGAPIKSQFNKDFSDPGDIASFVPSLVAAEEDVAAFSIVEGTAVVVNSVAHTVADFEYDGSGYVKLQLVET